MERQRHPGGAVKMVRTHCGARPPPDIASLYPGYERLRLSPAQKRQQRVPHDPAPVRIREEIERLGEVREVLTIGHFAALMREIGAPEAAARTESAEQSL